MTFKDVTDERQDIVTVMKLSGTNYDSIKIYERSGTAIIYTSTLNKKHLSISNPDRPIKNSEIAFSIKRILKDKISNVSITKNPSGVIHIYPKSS